MICMGLRLFVCEYVTGGGLAGRLLPPSLCREGDMMLGALVKDLRDLPGVELVLTRDARLTAPDGPPNGSVDIRRLEDGDDPWPVWRRIAAEADAAWPIAPETNGMLERLSGLILDAGCKLIGSRPAAVRLTELDIRHHEALLNDPLVATLVPNEPNLQLNPIPGLAYNVLQLNPSRPPMDNLKVRQAMAHALDRQAIVDSEAPPIIWMWVGPHSVTSWPKIRCHISSSGKPSTIALAPRAGRSHHGGGTGRTPGSGGGADGAYGAGVMVGWTNTGARPNFAVVTEYPRLVMRLGLSRIPRRTSPNGDRATTPSASRQSPSTAAAKK